MNFKRIGTGIAALSILATAFSAEAADIRRPVHKAPPAPVPYFSWSGFYLGINGGYGWGTSDWSGFVFASKPTGWLVGGTVGFNYQISSIVLGIEGDYDWADISASGVCAVGFTCGSRSSYLATFRGRVGLAFDRFLPYITGGAAFGNIKASLVGPATILAASQSRTGWTIGGGVEYAFLENWSAKLEYLYVDLGSYDTGFLTPLVANTSFRENIFRAGLNYRFGGGPLMSRY